jgi:cell division protein FtsZ
MSTSPTPLNKTSEDFDLEDGSSYTGDVQEQPIAPMPKTRGRPKASSLKAASEKQDEITFKTTKEPEKRMESDSELKPRIIVVGVGGAGGNAVNNMIRLNLQGVDFIVCNTDAQAIGQTLAHKKIRLGLNITQGLGAGSRPEVGRAAAEESLEEVMKEIAGSNMVFITAGMGGGTGTGAAPVIAQSARDMGILTVAVVTKPFNFEGAHRMKTAEKGIEDLQDYVDTLIVIPNQNLFRVANEKTTFADAFRMADDVLYSGVRGVTDLMMMPGLINLDFADIRAVMSEMGKAMMGTGEAEGENRAIAAAESAISNPLLDDVSMKGARGVLINITGGNDMTLFEVDEAANRIREEVDPDANIIFGSTFDESLDGKVRVSVVATGIDNGYAKMKSWASFKSKPLSSLSPAKEEASIKDDFSLTAEEDVEVDTDQTASLTSQEMPLEDASQEEGFAFENTTYNEQDSFFEEPQDRYEQSFDDIPQPRKKGLLSRFADKLRRGKSSEEAFFSYEEETSLDYGNRAQSKIVKDNEQNAENDELLDVPSYLRRKSNS